MAGHVRFLLDDEAAVLVLDEFAFHVRPQVEIAAVGDPFEFAVLPRFEERERVFEVRRADRIMREFFRRVFAENQILAADAQIEIPLIATIPPVGVPLRGFVGMAEELHLHLLEFARAKREIAGSDFVAETLADLGNAKGDLHTRAVDDVLEVHEHALGRFGTQKRDALFTTQGPDDRLEHQVEFAGLR